MKVNSKKAIITSVFSLITCVLMLIGSTFAWFTDDDEIEGNEVIAGTLDVAIVDESGADFSGGKLDFVKPSSASSESVVWEPGCTYNLTPFKVKNEGDLALTYKVEVSDLTGTNAGDLKNQIDWSFKVGSNAAVSLDEADNNEITLAAGATSDSIVISGTMKTTATGDNVMGKSLDGITIKVYAKQAASESDSNGNTYDSAAQY